MSLAETHDPEWKTARQKRREGIDDLVSMLPPDSGREFDEHDSMLFLEQLAEDYGPMEIGLSMGWSPAMVKRFIDDPERKAIIDMITDAQHESVERAIMQHARNGNSTAMKLYAFNKMGHRGWADRHQVTVTSHSQHEIVLSVREALEARTRQMIEAGGTDGVLALQSAFLDEDVIDAEVVEP